MKYTLHIGFANRQGVILNDAVQIGRVLGTSLYEFQRSWDALKARLVDTVDTQALSTRGYTGKDLPEDVLGNSKPSFSRNGSPAKPLAFGQPQTNGQAPKGGL